MSNHLRLQPEPLDLATINALCTHPSCGAVSFFCGTTRDNFEDKRVQSLEYEAYDRMALTSMTQICQELRTKWPDIVHIAIYHRLGLVPVCEASVIIGISSPHRQTSLDAVQVAIDRLKQIVPIWKKERYQAPSGAAAAAGQRRAPAKRPAPTVRLDFRTAPVPQAGGVRTQPQQIHANDAEFRRRLHCFLDTKRVEIDDGNVQDFIEPTAKAEGADVSAQGDQEQPEEQSCARVCSSVYRSKNASSHLRISRVKNEHGPQTQSSDQLTYTDALNKLMTPAAAEEGASAKRFLAAGCSAGVDERLRDAEYAIGLRSIAPSVYGRLKAIEERLRYLETVSPEYTHFVKSLSASSSSISSDHGHTKQHSQHAAAGHQKKITYSSADVDVFIQKLQQQSAQTT